MESQSFFISEKIPFEDVDEGVSRQLLAYDDQIMMVKVSFEEGSIGKTHHHPHRQTSYVDSGVFEVTIGEQIETLRAGDSFYVSPNEIHGVLCVEAGILIDVFNPAREDFLTD